MSAIGALVAVGLVIIAGRALVRRFGVPLDPQRALRWGAALLAASVAVGELRALRPEIARRLPALLHGGAGDAAPLVGYGALAIIGYRFLARRIGHGERERPQGLTERRRALPSPPPPEVPEGDGVP